MTAELFLAAFFALFPPKDDPREWARYATVAVAAEQAVAEQVERGWHKSPKELGASLLTALRFEAGGLDYDVHSGANTRNGFCLTQIHRSNGRWKDEVDDPRELTGTDYQSTLRCFRVAVRTLAGSLRYCLVPSKRQKDRFVTYWRQAMWSVWGTGHKCWLSRTAWKRAQFQMAVEGRVFEPDAHMRELVETARLGAH